MWRHKGVRYSALAVVVGAALFLIGSVGTSAAAIHWGLDLLLFGLVALAVCVLVAFFQRSD